MLIYWHIHFSVSEKVILKKGKLQKKFIIGKNIDKM